MTNPKDRTEVLVEIFSDHPVRDPEKLAFGFEGLARTLAGLAWNPSNPTPFTAVVKGGWGRGKTTLLRRTESLLQAPPEAGQDPRRKVNTLWFNAWKYPDETTVLAGLLGELLKQLRTGNLLEQFAVEVSERRGHIAKLVLGIAAPWMEKVVEGGGSFSRAEEARAFYDTFGTLFNEAMYLLQHPGQAWKDLAHRKVEEALDESQRKVVLAVFLDDLDRCREERVLEVMEAINLFMDLPGVCFYLGLDWMRLKELLGQKMEGREEAFLEKIVQVSLDLPPVNEPGVEAYVGQLLKGRALAEVFQEEDVKALAAAPGSSHPRHVKRFLNDLSMGLAVLRNTDKLGDGEEQVPERAMVAWHLLLAALPAEGEGLRASLGNLDGFLRRWSALEKTDQEGGLPDGVSEDVARVYRDQHLAGHLELLRSLKGHQRNTLVHFGSPPREERTRAARLAPGGELELVSLEGPAWVALDGGGFTMGSKDGESNERPLHPVTLPPFRISRYPVTNEQYARFVAETDKGPPRHWKEGQVPEGLERHPVARVSWIDAQAFCEWLSRTVGKGAFLLPSEAQWEFAARGAGGRTYPWGHDEPDENRANFGTNVGGTTPVDAYPGGGTPEGVHDLAGNVWEWCQDTWHVNYEGAPDDGSAWEGGDGTGCVLRGGSFGHNARNLRAACRLNGPPGYESVVIGFRVVWLAAGGQD